VTKHYSEEDLILYFYEERARRGDIQSHLDTCAECASAYRALAATLKMIDTPEAPERGEQYGLEVWQRIRHRLPEQEMPWWSVWFRADRLALIGACAVLVIAAFVAGRWWSAGDAPGTIVVSAPPESPTSDAPRPDANAARNRILLTSVAEHLDRSERVLTEIMNTRAGGDISAEQRWAEDLVAASRLYRQDASDAGEHSVAIVLDELERNLLEIVHSPSKATAATLDQLRRRIDAASLLFKVRVLGDELRQREQPQDVQRPRVLSTHTS
jgi:hypothetical protein